MDIQQQHDELVTKVMDIITGTGIESPRGVRLSLLENILSIYMRIVTHEYATSLGLAPIHPNRFREGTEAWLVDYAPPDGQWDHKGYLVRLNEAWCAAHELLAAFERDVSRARTNQILAEINSVALLRTRTGDHFDSLSNGALSNMLEGLRACGLRDDEHLATMELSELMHLIARATINRARSMMDQRAVVN